MDILTILSQLSEPQRLLIAVVGAVAVMLAGLLVLAYFVRRARQPERPAEGSVTQPTGMLPAKTAEHHTPPYLPALPSGPTLIVESSGQVVTLGELPVVLGRAPESALVLDHPSVSSHHARIYRDPNFGLCIEDLGSLNGLYVDQQLTRRNLLHRDCHLSLGETSVLFRAGTGKA